MPERIQCRQGAPNGYGAHLHAALMRLLVQPATGETDHA